MPALPLHLLDPHPHNANRMTPALLAKLTAHVRSTGEYPPLIVRRHPTDEGRYQILDGHHRAQALRSLGHAEARCEIWNADDQQASLLLLTLNRLHGEDDPHKRSALLDGLSRSMSIDALARLVPEDAPKLKRIIALGQRPPALAPPPRLDRMPQALTFLTARQRDRLLEHLRQVARDRSEAIVRLLALDEP